jgi:hypothetical protein
MKLETSLMTWIALVMVIENSGKLRDFWYGLPL